MSRRRPSFRAYVRRRWRAVGLILVLLAGSLLVLAVTDRGHDPVWEARGVLVEQAVPSPDGRAVYVLVRDGASIVRLEARDGATGAVVWESPMSATSALLRAGDEGVAVATDFPYAFLTYYGRDGTPRFQYALEGNPRAMAVEGDRIALALNAATNPILVAEGGAIARTYNHSSIVNTLDLRSGRLAVGTASGQLVVRAADGSPLLNVSLTMNVRSLRLDASGDVLVAGGQTLGVGALSGSVALLDVDAPQPLRWSQTTGATVGLVDVDAAGTVALAVEDTPPRHILRAYDAASGSTRWTAPIDGIVSRDDAGAFGGAALSPDGCYAVVSTLRGPVVALDAANGRAAWSYGASGTTFVAFARGSGDRFVATTRLVQNGPYDALLLFSAAAEPTLGRLPTLAALVTVIVAVAGATALGVGYWRLRRSY